MLTQRKFIPPGRHAYSPGEKLGMMTLVEYLGWADGRGKWLAECECGCRRAINPYPYRIGRSKSCGCYRGSDAHKAAISASMRQYQRVQLRDPKNIRLMREVRGPAAEEWIHVDFRYES